MENNGGFPDRSNSKTADGVFTDKEWSHVQLYKKLLTKQI